PSAQHAVMIEAVENHMPEAIIIDEIGTELEAEAARTIAERGVQLVGTAHGNTLENLMMNPTLADLIGGIQTVTLSDEEARRRGTQKSVLERKAPPTFDVLVEIQSWNRVAVHANVAETVDDILRGRVTRAEIREIDADGVIQRSLAPRPGDPAASTDTPRNGATPHATPTANAVDDEDDSGWGHSPTLPAAAPRFASMAAGPLKTRRIYPFGISRHRLQQAVKDLGVPALVVDSLDEADVVMTLKSYYRQRNPGLREAEARGVPIFVLKQNSVLQMEQSLGHMFELGVMENDPIQSAMAEAEEAIDRVMREKRAVELQPQNAFVRRLQHELAERYHLVSESMGREPNRRVRISVASENRSAG
ncbi:MAG: AAA family ATPase, partial [Dehalococcoidia bacterium]|nr:AAA family ATPase [Dehalococcoidia bacterium]